MNKQDRELHKTALKNSIRLHGFKILSIGKHILSIRMKGNKYIVQGTPELERRTFDLDELFDFIKRS